ncbi:hypothetical protein VQ02_00025 [Methylobacterium variabile]|jgi:hypothetical protein|uniref:ACT domain-containing protein n=1 Tax=Methylobacterium variabile TaxID=298794 RepID=A0A0J6TCU7_9HYPH|nr:hypothetical protein [Methylobacterium variabile]KMO43448.1 hypothetical protein VQ02_00025 [Methylobacterium variabile]
MARDQGHPVEIRARIAHVFDGVTRLLGEVERAGYPVRNLALDAGSAPSAVTLSILVPDGTDLTFLAARLARHPAVVEARVGAPGSATPA